MWTKNSVDAVLKSYIDDKARALHLAIEIGELEKRINAAIASLASDEAGPGAQVITGMPHGTALSNPTEQIAVRLASGWVPPEIKEWKQDLAQKKEEHEALTTKVRYVDAWMSALSDREHWIMLHQFIRGEFWRDIVTDYNAKFGGYVTKDTLKWLRGKALKTIYAAAGIRN